MDGNRHEEISEVVGDANFAGPPKQAGWGLMGCRSWGCAALPRRCRGGSRPGRLVTLCMSLAIGVALPGYAIAADQPAPFQNTPEAREADELFQQLLKDPKNVDLTFRYAQAAIKSGNIEGADFVA